MAQNVNFRLDEDVKKGMEQVCTELGMSMTTAFTIFAKKVWRDVNLKNLHEYIEPTKKRADMIIKKYGNHEISDMYIKKF